jgi:L-threonylcarbamoyladenylate synthase
MPTPILSCAPDKLDASLARAAETLRAGGLVAFPTETVYGLGANALDADAVARIFAAKGRPATNPVIVHVATVEEVALVAAHWPEAAARLAAAFWPGPLTLVLARRPEVPDVVTAGGPTVAVRIPAHPVALRLLTMLGLPVAAPSANRSNRLSPTTAEHVFRDLDGRIDLLLDGGPTPGGIESTVVDVTSRPARLLRPGLIDPTAIERIIGPIVRPVEQASRLLLHDSQSQAGRLSYDVEQASRLLPSVPLPSPGMLSRHYAPRTPLECVEGDGMARIRELRAAGLRVALVTRRTNQAMLPVMGGGRVAGVEDPGSLPLASTQGVERVKCSGVFDPSHPLLSMPADPAGYAARLYGALHDLDAEGFDRLVVELPPDEDAWLAVRDRLRRASS